MDNSSSGNSGSNIQIISALILSIFASLSSLILHYKLKHFKICCLESDCVTSPPPTPRVDAPLKPHIKPLTKESEQHKSQEN